MNDTVAHFRNVERTRGQLSNSEESSQVKEEYSRWFTGKDIVDFTSTLTIYLIDRLQRRNLTLLKQSKD